MLTCNAVRARRVIVPGLCLRFFGSVFLAAASLMLVSPPSYGQASPRTITFNIPAQALPGALNEFARQAKVSLAFSESGYDTVLANPVVGAYERHRALQLLLSGTGLKVSLESEDSFVVQRGQNTATPTTGYPAFTGEPTFLAQTPPGSRPTSPSTEHSASSDGQAGSPTGDDPSDSRKLQPFDEIVVTGSSIRGVIPESSPLQVYDAIDIKNTGALTVEQFVSRLPQNNNTLSEIGGGSSSRAPNNNSNNSVDLRGLGVGSTLVLLNGRRVAPSSNGRTPDVSFIPIGAVERVEVLSDGASANYGADAIGGVINFVLKDQQDGFETVLTFGGADGGSEQVRVDQSFGFNWIDGNALVAASYFERKELDAADRSFSREATPFTLVPEDSRINLLATVSQLIADDVRISGDLLYSAREPRSVRAQPLLGEGNISVRVADQEQTVLNLAVERQFGRVNADLLLTYADASTDASGTVDGPALGVGPFLEKEDTTTLDVTAKLDGELASLRSGAMMFALGAGYTEDEFESLLDFSVPQGFPATSAALDRTTKYAFAELQIPFVSPSQNISGVRRLELNLAARYTDHSDFGDDTSPKIGVLWSPVEQLKFRGTFSESFKAPFLFQRDSSGALNALFPIAALGAPDIWTPDNSAVVLFVQGSGNPTLGPEKAETTTFGVDIELSDFTVSATYFDIDYTDRIGKPDPTNGIAPFVNPEDFPDLFDLSPTLEEVTAALSVSQNFLNLTGIDIGDPGAVHAATTVFFDNRIQNLSISQMDGLDFSFSYTAETSIGEIDFGITASKMFDFEERVSPSAAPISRVDTVLFPADLKARSYFGIGQNRWSARVNLNFVDDYENPFSSANSIIDDWTTVDLLLSYEVLANVDSVFDGVQLGLTVQNIFDEDPPFVPVGTSSDMSLFNPTGFDPANSNPLGRFINLRFSKAW